MHGMEWNDRLATRHPGMARDHRKAVDLINRLGEAMAAGKGRFDYCAILDEIVRHTQSHFAMEERLMAAHRYPGALEHGAEHASLLKKLLGHKRGVEEGNADMTASLEPFLAFWWTHHILESDVGMAEFITAQTAGKDD